MEDEQILPKVTEDTLNTLIRDMASRTDKGRAYTAELDKILGVFRTENPVLYKEIEEHIEQAFPEGPLRANALVIAQTVYFGLRYQTQAEQMKKEI